MSQNNEKSWTGSLSRRPGFWLALLIVAGAAAALAVRARGPLVDVTAVTRTDIAQRVVATGRVRVVSRIAVSSQAAGRVAAVGVREGERVAAGSRLALLDDREARAAEAEAAGAVRRASAALAEVGAVTRIVASEAGREAATALNRAESDLARAERLAEAGALSATDLDEARRQLDVAKARKAAADAQRAGAAGPETASAQAAVEQAQATLAAARARLAQRTVVAPRAGVILSRTVEPGQVVSPGEALFELAADGDTELVIEPDERHLASIRLGQSADVAADAFPDRVFKAEVSYIAPAVDPRRGTVEVRLRVADPPDFLKPDMTVSVDLAVRTRPDVIAVPTDAVRGAATDAPWVFVVRDGRLHRQEVTLGVRGLDVSELARGAEAGDLVVLGNGAWTDGQRVRVNRRAF